MSIKKLLAAGVRRILRSNFLSENQERLRLCSGYAQGTEQLKEKDALKWTGQLNNIKTCARERLLEQIWDNNGNYVNENTLTVTMKRLRDKLHQPSCLKNLCLLVWFFC